MNESTEREFGGWAVSVAVFQQIGDQVQIYTKPYTISTFERADAERYAYDETARVYSPDQGWSIITSAMPIWWVPVQEPS